MRRVTSVEDRTARPPKGLVGIEEDPVGQGGGTASRSGSDAAAETTVRELLGSEGGLWSVLTEGSCHSFDLDRRTVVRVPGPGALPLRGDLARRLRGIESCCVDSSGSRTLEADPWDQENDYYLHTSSVIREIRRITTAGPERERNTGIDPATPVTGPPVAVSSAESLAKDRRPRREPTSDVADVAEL